MEPILLEKKMQIMVSLLFLLPGVLTAEEPAEKSAPQSPLPPQAVVKKIAGGFRFTEGITSDPNGLLFFSDIPPGLIYKMTQDGTTSVFCQTHNANGLQALPDGTLIVCESSGPRRLLRMDRQGKITVLADGYEGKPFNSPNDCWMDPHGGVYMTDPRYGNRDDMEMGEHVYYISPDREVLRVIDDLIRPNGLIGTPDGKTLYVADHGDGKTWAYDIQKDGTLTNKRLFCTDGSDGMTMDSEGNVYLTWRREVRIYAPDGTLLESIRLPEGPTNLCFGGGEDRQTLYITARTSVYTLRMRTGGAGSN